jgi:DNA repair exonuclease SbcCD ATPase subunit
MRQWLKGAALVSACALALACSKGPAEAALKAAEAAVEQARPQLEKLVPAEWASVQEAVKGARSQFDQGNYKEAMQAAQALTPKVQQAVTAAAAKAAELTQAFQGVQGTLPGLVEQLTAKVAELGAMKRLPKGLDAAALQAAQADLSGLTQGLTEAMTAFQNGNLPQAVEQANALKAKAEALAQALGVVAAAPAAGSKPE